MPAPRKVILADGSAVWRVRFRIGKRQSSRAFRSERAAKVFIHDLLGHGPEYATTLADEADRHANSPTLDTVFDEFVKWKARRVRSDRTVHDYKRDYDNHIKPVFGDIPVTAITVHMVRAWVDQLADPDREPSPLQPKTVAGYHALLHQVIKYAMDPARGYLDTDPCINPELPKRHRKPPRGLSPASWATLHTALTAVDADAADLAWFLLASGWRFSESTALTGAQVSTRTVDNTPVTVVTMDRVARLGADSRRHTVSDAKSMAGLRATTLDPETGAMVQTRAKAAGKNGRVFTPAPGRVWHYSTFKRSWDTAVDNAGLADVLGVRPTPHWLRHTHVGWLLMAGAPVAEVQRRAGHASITQTMAYASMVLDVKPETLGVFAAAVRKPTGDGTGQTTAGT